MRRLPRAGERHASKHATNAEPRLLSERQYVHQLLWQKDDRVAVRAQRMRDDASFKGVRMRRHHSTDAGPPAADPEKRPRE